MLQLTNKEDLREHMKHGADKPLISVSVWDPKDETKARQFHEKTVDALYEDLLKFLEHHHGIWKLVFKRSPTDPQNFMAEWYPRGADAMQGAPGYAGNESVEAIVNRKLEEYKQKEYVKELEDQVQEFGTLQGKAVMMLEPLLERLIQKFAPGMAGGAPQMQGVPGQSFDELSEDDRARVLFGVNNMLAHVEPEFIQHVGQWIASNPQMIESVKQLTQYGQAESENANQGA